MIEAAAGSSFLRLDALDYRYPGTDYGLRDIDLRLDAGEFHCLLGRSGCGKSTLLKLAAGLLQPTAGRVLLQGKPLFKPTSAIGFVFQQPTLLDWLTVLDNVLLPASLKGRAQGRAGAAIRDDALQLLDELELGSHAHRYPTQLSGGQQSRVAIARAMLMRPALLLMDEPFAALDALTREQLQDTLLYTCGQHGSTVLFVTHDIAEAVYLADRVTVLDDGRQAHCQPVNLPRPRHSALRDSPAYHHACAELRSHIGRVP
ncbi:ABC transporter ATP-binding protein [Paracandidimonas lactea]|uniref:ABC transporter ATP-binding protein n=1 Tax=Paracandidimonas lactea TaxID=2895524 RepID=UPI001F182BB9